MDELTIYRFQPDAMSKETLEKIFVGNKHKQLLERLYEEIKEAAKARKPKYYLIVGPRGIGKTHLITLLYYRLSGVEEAFPVKLSEEEFSVYRVSDLLQRILEVIGQNRIFSLKFEGMAEDDIVVVSLEELKKFNKSLVIFIENLDQIIGKQMSESEVKRLRSLFQTENMFIVVATAPIIFPEISSHEAPFFDFFEIVYISELTRDELKELLKRLAELDENANFLKEIGKLEHRIDAIATLTGGNPRIAILLYDLTKVGKLLDVEKAFFRILDDYTPYYQDLFKMLSGEQRRIFDELISVGKPATPKELALRTRLSQNTVISQLRRLEKDGFVISHKIGKKTLYEVKDKLFRLWRELRKEPFGRERLSILIKFLEVWYSLQERVEILSKYITDLDLEKIEEERTLREISYWFLSIPAEHRWKFLPDLVKKSSELGKEQILEAIAYDEKTKTEVTFAKILFMIEKGEYKEALKTIDREPRWQNTPIPWILRSAVFVSQKKLEDALNAIDKAFKLYMETPLWVLKGEILLMAGRLEDALQISSKAIEMNPKLAIVWNLHSRVLKKLGKWEESLEAAKKAVQLDPYDSNAWKHIGEILMDMEKYSEALEAFEKAMELSPGDIEVWISKGFALKIAKREKEAQEAFLKSLYITDQMIKTKPNDSVAWANRVGAFLGLRRFKDAASAALKVADLTSDAEVKQGSINMAVYCFLRDSFLELRKQNIGNSIESLKYALELIRKSEPTEEQIKITIEQLTQFLARIVGLRDVEALRLAVNEISNSLEFSKDFIKPFEVALEIVETGDINKYYDIQPELREIVAKIVAILTGSDKLAPPKEQK